MNDYTFTPYNACYWYQLNDDMQNDMIIDETFRFHWIDGVRYFEIDYYDTTHNTYELSPIMHGPRPCDG